jgi:enoyl-CoA hydratase/carnithine racemase
VTASQASETLVARQIDGGVATLFLDNPPLNTITSALANQLVAALEWAGALGEVRAIVLTGAGTTFCAGADLSAGPRALRELFAGDGGGRVDYREPAGRITAAIEALEVPVVVAINGDAIGGGLTITLAADARFAAADARFALPFVKLGVSPEGGCTYHLPRLVGAGRAREWLVSGRMFDADEAIAAGLVTHSAARSDVLAAAQQWAHAVARHTSPTAVAATRALLVAEPACSDAASERETGVILNLAARYDCAEGIAAFRERRPPEFTLRGSNERDHRWHT